MSEKSERLHLTIEGATRRDLGSDRGRQLRTRLRASYEKYAELFRTLGVSEEHEQEGARRVLAAIRGWRPEIVDEFAGITEGSGLELERVIALNARTEILALAGAASHECSTLTVDLGGHRYGSQTWDWHVELDPFWHTQTVAGPGHRYAGLTENGILSKIGVNDAGLALHFNILGHRDDGPDGVPIHVLSAVVLAECASVAEAVELLREAPIASSSAFTMIDAGTAVSVEMSPAGVFVIDEVAGSVQRTNNFQHEVPLAQQKSALYEPDSSARLALVRERVRAALQSRSSELAEPRALAELLVTGEGQPPLTCVPDMALGYGDRWASLATVVTDPDAHAIHIFDGMPTEAVTGDWRMLVA